MNINDERVNKCLESIQSLIQKYKDNDYMLQRISNRIINYLPNELEYDFEKHKKNINRNIFLTNEQQVFIQIFLSKNQYYYLTNNSCFYEYTGKNYIIVKEDDIIHNLLSTISKGRVLLEWKHKTKKNVIGLIKERSLLHSIPETYTIQNVLNSLYPSMFVNKQNAKFFLTIIGDNILKKNQNIIYLVTPKTKKILNELENIAYLSIGVTNLTNNFMTKYHENYTFTNCRLIKINDNVSVDMWKDLLKKVGLNLLCVSAHYSNRYENADNFVETKADEELKNYSYYLKNNNQNEIVSLFSNKFLQSVSGTKIGWKNLHFIWKQFLSNSNLPNMIYSNALKSILKEKYNYDELTDSFINITSKYLPIESDFIKFWEKNINVYTNESQLIDNELEIDELCSLFKNWVKNSNEELLSNGTISEENVVKILTHFFPDVEIIEDKYIFNASCILWDKNKDIQKSFLFIKNKLIESYTLPLISFDDVYNYYCKYCSSNSNKFVVSKRYFEKYLYTKISDCIVYEKFIDTNWILNQSCSI